MNLSDDLKKVSDYNSYQSSQVVQSMEELASSGIVQSSLQVGDRAPDFTLVSTKGESVKLQDLLRSGAVVVSCFRGNWCSYCSLELQALEEILPAILELKASLVSISPQVFRRRQPSVEDNLTHPILIDTNNHLARQLGIVYKMGDSLRELYAEFDLPVNKFNGTEDNYELPVPATFIIDSEGTIVYRFVDPDYRKRLDPIEIITVLTKLKK